MIAKQKKPMYSAFLINFAAFVIVIAGLHSAKDIVVLFLLSIFIAIIATPTLFWIEKRGVPRWIAFFIVIAFLVLILTGVGLVIQSSFDHFLKNFPIYSEQLQEKLFLAIDFLEQYNIAITRDELIKYFDPTNILGATKTIFSSLGSLVSNTFLITLIVGFILFESHIFESKIKRITGNRDYFTPFVEKVKHYIVIKSITSLITGILIAIGLSLLGVEYAILWGVLAFLLNFIPTIGSIIASIPAIIFTLLQLGFIDAFWVVVIYLVVNVTIGSIIEPRFLGKELGLSTLVVFSSMLFWGWVFGPIGMFLSVPLTMMLKIALETKKETRWIAILLGSK